MEARHQRKKAKSSDESGSDDNDSLLDGFVRRAEQRTHYENVDLHFPLRHVCLAGAILNQPFFFHTVIIYQCFNDV